MYPKEMINIVKNFYKSNKYSIREVSEIFKISKSTIHRWINIDNKNKKCKNASDYEIIKETIENIVKENPFIRIKDIQNKIKNIICKDISVSGIYLYLTKLNITYKLASQKLYSNMNNLKQKVKEFKKIIKNIKLKNIVCLDESYIMTNMCHKYGWSKKGERITKYIKANPKKFSIMMAIDNKKIISSKIYNVNINKEIFYEYLKNELLPKIKNKYIIMDNVSFHKSKEIKELILKSKNKIIYIPPYSPEYNPIEGVFHILKNKIRQKDEIINEKNIKCIIGEINNKYQKMYKKSFR